LHRARGFRFPGTPGSAPPLLAQHDWVHVLADYGTTVENEVETFGFIARANDDMRAFSLLAMVICLFETGYLRSGAGLFESAPGHLSADPGLAVRLADALRRGALCRDIQTDDDSIDYMRLDWFELAALPLASVRERFSVVPKSPGRSRPDRSVRGSLVGSARSSSTRARSSQQSSAYPTSRSDRRSDDGPGFVGSTRRHPVGVHA
jgi:hypothetical protein